ncbi:hypothetical protein [Archangium violaceum]|uniref:Uncharacterized protein n=1 Tax=Archangium violaceum Cb vi76 TaxID=1406225 RepID=A0A084SHL6_9BACT|nr:hypothetical protein [Archangium violaceum]KFA87951.1 hypothetical protein Q664_44305 [Archangium violaceum Cb vi76]
MKAPREGTPGDDASRRFERQMREGFTGLLEPGAWSSLLQPVLGFQLGWIRSLHQAMEEAGPRTPRARLDEVLRGLLEVVEPLGPPEERLARRRLMIEYADVLTAYAGLMRELARDVEDEEQPRPSVPNY